MINQSYTDWECIIVDDGSTDNSLDIARELMKIDSRIKVISKINGGVCSARNKGIENARGLYVLPLDADDYISNNYLEQSHKWMMQSPLTKVVFGVVEFFGDRNELEHKSVKFNFHNQLYYNQIHCSGVYRREDAILIGGYDESMLYGYEDWDFYIRLLDGVNDVVQLDNCTLYYRKKAVSRSTELYTGIKEMITMNHLISKNIERYSKFNISVMDEIRFARQVQFMPESLFSYHYIFKLIIKKMLRTMNIFLINLRQFFCKFLCFKQKFSLFLYFFFVI